MNFLKALFIFLLLTIPFAQVGRLQLGSGVAITINDIAVAIIAIVWFGRTISKKKLKNLNSALSKPIFIFIIVAFSSLIINIPNLKPFELLVSSLYLIRWVLYACLFFVVASFDSKFKTKIAYLLMMASFILVLLGFIQYFLYSDLRNLYYLGWDEHLYRLFSTFLDPNFAGAFFVLYLIFLSGILLYFLKNDKKNLVILTIVIILLTLLATYLTFSRSAALMLLGSFLTFFVLINSKKWMVGLILISLIFLAVSSKNIYIENTYLFRTASIEARLDSARNAIQIIKDNIVIGVGFNAYRYAQIRYKFIDGKETLKNHAGAGTDNSFLFISSTTGLIGLLSFLYLLFSILKRAYINYRATKKGEIINILSIIVIASFIGIIFDSIFINSLFYPFNMMWLWILVGLMENK